jgi:hypothetical protein
MARIAVRNLFSDSVLTKPINYDWSEGYGERWEVVLPDSEDRAAQRYFDVDEEDAQDRREHCMDRMSESIQPMMNYYYPLATSFGKSYRQEDAKNVMGTCCCIVQFLDSEEYGLALTGGGMDLSWEICEAYIRLGFLPPLHFSDLPQMGGERLTATKRLILAACRRSAIIVRGWANSTLRSLKHTRQVYAANSRRYEA